MIILNAVCQSGLMGRPAKSLFVGSNPTVASKYYRESK